MNAQIKYLVTRNQRITLLTNQKINMQKINANLEKIAFLQQRNRQKGINQKLPQQKINALVMHFEVIL